MLLEEQAGWELWDSGTNKKKDLVDKGKEIKWEILGEHVSVTHL